MQDDPADCARSSCLDYRSRPDEQTTTSGSRSNPVLHANLITRPSVSEWINPSSRFPAFYVEPLHESALALGRLLFVASIQAGGLSTRTLDDPRVVKVTRLIDLNPEKKLTMVDTESAASGIGRLERLGAFSCHKARRLLYHLAGDYLSSSQPFLRLIAQ